EDRRAHLIGYVNAAFRMNDLMTGLSGNPSAGLELEVYDGDEISELTIMYDSDGIPINLEADDSQLKSIWHITIADHDWTLVTQPSANFEALTNNTKPVLVATTGVVFSILLALLVHAYLRSEKISRELQGSEERWRFALEGAGEGVWDWDIQTNEVIYSRQWKTVLGYSDDEMQNIYSEWQKRIHPDDLQKTLADIEEYIAGNTPAFVNEHRLRHKNGSWVWVLGRGMVISRDKHGKPLRMIGTLVDITEQKQTGEKLHESERYNRMLFEQSPIGLMLCRMNGELVDINLAFARTIGMTIKEALQLSYWDITPIKYAEDEQRQMESLAKTRHYGPYEKEYVHKDGHLVPVRLHGRLIEKGDETFIWSSVEDVTENKRITQILQSLASSSTSAQNFKHFLQGALDSLTKFYGCKYAFVGQLLPDGKRVRTLAVRVDGQPAGNFEYDLKGTPCQDVLNLKLELIPRDASKLYAKDKMLVDMGVSSYYGSPLCNTDNKMIGLISLLHTEPMVIDPWSAPLLKIVASRITLELERLDADKALQEQHDFNDTVVETAGNVIVIMDTSGRITRFNRAAENLTGFRREQVLGQPVWDWVIPEEQKTGVQKVFDQLIHGNVNIAGHHVNDWLTHDGSRRTLDWRNTILRDEHDTPRYVVALGYDITKRLQIENDLKQLTTTLEARVEERTQELKLAKDLADTANQAKSNFLSNMSHEIRSPLAAIIGFSESLVTDNYNEQERKKITSTIVRNSKHLLQVVNDILDLSKIEADQLEVELINTSIFLLLGEVDSLMGMNARNKGLEFKINYHFPLPQSIVTDPTCLKQILINLCSNAIKFTHEGHIEVYVSCDSDFRQLQIVVSDSGIGMTAEEALRIFKPFSQADSSTTRKHGGTGLGLSISIKLAKALDGSLDSESRKGQGSQFTLTIANQDKNDIVVIDRLEDVSLYDTDQDEKIDIKPLAGSILLVDDSLDNQQLISMFIRKTGAQVTLAENGQQAVEKALAGEFDLILMDMQMPVMDGIEAIHRLRAGGYKRPIVSLTANVLLSDREKCKAAGADDYLTKPVDLHQFYHVLNSYLTEDTARMNVDKSQQLKKAMQDNPQYKAIVDRFLAKLPQMLEEISTALTEKNWAELQTKSHNLKGVGGSLGYPEITELAGRLNTLVKQQNYELLADASSELDKLCRGILHKNNLSQ
nr:PAS domain S-box protein [Gammaproteobacteria bacterium]